MMVSSGNTVMLQTVKIRRPCLGQGRGGGLGPPEVWNLLCHGHGPHIPATKPFRRPFQGNSRSFPQAFPRQLSQLHAPDNPSNPSASLSKATLAATGPRQCFKPFRRPFQGNSRSYRPQPSVFKGVQDCRLPAFKPQKKSGQVQKTCASPEKGCPGPKKHASRKNASISCRPKAALDRWRSDPLLPISGDHPGRLHPLCLTAGTRGSSPRHKWKWIPVRSENEIII